MSSPEGMPHDMRQLATEVLGGLRQQEGSFEDLSSPLQRLYEELGARCLSHVVENPRYAKLLGKFGSNEEAFGISVGEVDEAMLRLHYYDEAGVSTVHPNDMQQKPIDLDKYGTPHNHVGNISSVVPAGRLTHHLFQPTQGDEYTAGNIEFIKAPNPNESYKFARSIFKPVEKIGLEPIDEAIVEPGRGYWMHQDAVHVVSWPEQTITVFFNDFKHRRPGTVYQQGEIVNELERPRLLSDEEKQRIWQSFAKLATKNF